MSWPSCPIQGELSGRHVPPLPPNWDRDSKNLTLKNHLLYIERKVSVESCLKKNPSFCTFAKKFHYYHNFSQAVLAKSMYFFAKYETENFHVNSIKD
jgi:hypothetical protein